MSLSLQNLQVFPQLEGEAEIDLGIAQLLQHRKRRSSEKILGSTVDPETNRLWALRPPDAGT